MANMLERLPSEILGEDHVLLQALVAFKAGSRKGYEEKRKVK